MNDGNVLMRGIYLLSEWISRFFFANVLWILFTLAGFGVLGIIPSTVALFTVTRKWIMGETDIPLLKTFLGTYRKEFLRVNFYGFILFLFAFFLYWDIKFLRTQDNNILQMVSFLILGFSLIFMVILCFLLPVYVHYELKFLETVTFSIGLAVTNPLWTLMEILTYGFAFFLTMKIPSMIPFFSASLTAFAVNWIAHRIFTKNESNLKNHS